MRMSSQAMNKQLTLLRKMQHFGTHSIFAQTSTVSFHDAIGTVNSATQSS